MKIALDMQSRQTTGSRERGIGRYSLSLAKAMLELGQAHTFSILLNGVFHRTVDQVRADFGADKDDPRIQVYQTLPASTEWTREDAWRHKASEFLRESYLAAQSFDFVHCTSLFESPMDDSSTSWGQVANGAQHAVTLYDLIPYAFPETYLAERPMRSSYLRKIQDLRKADLLLAISEFSRREAIERLDIDPARVVNIAGAADDRFRPLQVPAARRDSLLGRHGLGRFVMYTGGIDHRKNIERLIQAYAQLPAPLIAQYQLVIVCSVQPYQRDQLLRLAAAHGLAPDRLVMTGFVSDDDLVDFYNLCDLFVFPSWCEGFGLPALEAMQCGAPVIAANTSSLPEVVGLDAALFNPYDIQDMAARMTQALQDEAFRTRLTEHGREYARRFTWRGSAATALAAMEEAHARRQPVPSSWPLSRRPRLAFVSPLPPSKSGIAGYSAQLLPALDQHYDITLICKPGSVSDAYLDANFPVHTPQWLLDNADRFDRVVYQFGNSDHHDYMFRLLESVPGTVVLHDFWLSHVLEYIQLYQHDTNLWDEHLHYSHGWPGLAQRRGGAGDIPVVNRFPCNRRVLESAVGVILHSQYSAQLAADWYGQDILRNVELVNSLKGLAPNIDKAASKTALGLPVDERVICSFGFIHSSKHSLRLAEAFMATALYREGKARLVLVGQNADGEYGREIARVVTQSEGRVSFTGFVSDAEYALYLGAADAAVQLRGVSRGETSAAALDCLAHDAVLAINENGAFSQLPDDCVIKLPAEFDDAALVALLEDLFKDEQRMQCLRAAGRDYLLRECHPAQVAARYRDAIELFHARHPVALRDQVARAMADVRTEVPAGVDDLESAVTAATANFPNAAAQRHSYLDENLLTGLDESALEGLRERFLSADDRRLELLRLEHEQYFNAADRVSTLLGLSVVSGPARPFDPGAGDVIVLAGESVLSLGPKAPSLHRLLRDVRLSSARLLVHWSHLELALQEHGVAQLGRVLTPLLQASEAIYVESRAAAGIVSDQLLLLRKALGGKIPQVLYPDAQAQHGAQLLLQLAGQGASPGWRTHALPADVRTWAADDPALITQSGQLRDGCYVSKGAEGYLVYGPYASMQAGTHHLRVVGSIDELPGDEHARFEIAADRGNQMLAQGPLQTGGWSLVDVRFELSEPVRDLEIRIFTSAFTRMAVRGYYLAQSEAAPLPGEY